MIDKILDLINEDTTTLYLKKDDFELFYNYTKNLPGPFQRFYNDEWFIYTDENKKVRVYNVDCDRNTFSR